MRIHNISDHPKFTPVHIKYKRGTIKPGESVELDQTLVPSAPCIVTELPSFYTEWKTAGTKRVNKVQEQLIESLKNFSEATSKFAEVVSSLAPKEELVEEKPKKKNK